VLPLLAGLAELGFFVVHGRPASIPGQVWAFVPGFALIMIGLVTAGPWLTMTGARIMARCTSRPGAPIAARRLADDPRAGFRAVSGLVLALFITTVAVAVITTQNTKRSGSLDGAPAGNVLVDQFVFGISPSHGSPPGAGSVAGSALGSAPAAPAEALARLRRISGVQGIAELRADPGLTMSSPHLGIPPGFPAAVVSCAQLASTPALGRCAAGAAAAKISPFLTAGHFSGQSLAGVTWPAADIPAKRLGSLPLYSVAVATEGSVAAVEQARTVLENAYPTGVGSPHTLGEDTTAQNTADNAYQRLADVVILTSLAIAGCALAASVAAGLADRKRSFSLLRLAGARLGMLRRVVVLESAIPLVAVAAVDRHRVRRLGDVHDRPAGASPDGAGRRVLRHNCGRDRAGPRRHRGHVPAAAPHHRPRDRTKRMIGLTSDPNLAAIAATCPDDLAHCARSRSLMR
jgi:hypothetical protein